MATEAQIIANRQNAKLSHGAVTPEGREICSKNALKHGLCGETVLLPTEDVEAYNKLVAIINDKYRPETEPEKLLIQEIADTEWKLLRIPVLQSGMFALGRLENKHIYQDCNFTEQERAAVLEALVYRLYAKDLSNLLLQQGRWQRFLEKKTAEFKELRKEREIVQTVHRNMAMQSIMRDGPPGHRSIGFEFSLEYLVARVEFCHYAKGADVTLFDRTWRDKSAKTPL
jgi:hypothetical protein